jgi:hypothetical protein
MGSEFHVSINICRVNLKYVKIDIHCQRVKSSIECVDELLLNYNANSSFLKIKCSIN